MRERVVIKWGGGLITDKTTLCTPQLDVIEALATSVRRCLDNEVDVILVHGAGSFGHLRAKHWRLNEGRVDAEFTPDDQCQSQADAVACVRQEMLALNDHVCTALQQQGVPTVIHPPHH
ncbi:MAG: hypothetical protein P8R03_07610, partial [Candidatus Poseidoniaceae archaeon]|nr:hypothetical protein [Candidatus Poseidoniaceae archaeon]